MFANTAKCILRTRTNLTVTKKKYTKQWKRNGTTGAATIECHLKSMKSWIGKRQHGIV
jgi:hypothetical protein